MGSNRKAAQMAIGAILGFSTTYAYTHDYSWVWVVLMGSLAVLNILSAFVTVTRKEDDA